MNRYYCQQCVKGFDSIEWWENHKWKGECKAVKCTFCKMEFDSVEAWTKHFHEAHKPDMAKLSTESEE